jgi:predicted protein tyrosine phosphatase
MGYGVHSNSYQGDYKRVLTVCSANMLRSPTMAHVLSAEPYNFNTRSAGTSDFALIPVTNDLLMWADEIVCADSEHTTVINRMLQKLDIDKPLINLRIPDVYEYRNEGLIDLIKLRYDDILMTRKGKE